MIERDSAQWLEIPAHDTTLSFRIVITESPLAVADEVLQPARRLSDYTNGGSPRWPERITTQIRRKYDAAFAVDELTLPADNPWNCQVRPTGHDFFADGDRAAVCTWDGDVWLVSGIRRESGILTWRRIAAGLFQPLGLKIVDEEIYLTCRDQLVRLRDLNDDGEIDFYACASNDHQVTEHFHEFAMGLQVDDAGNFYYAKSARHAKRAVVPHHGTLLRVSPDGTRTDILATGFRAANGVCLNPDGSFFVTDQEGHWNPKNRINLVQEGGFYGNLYGFTDVTDPSDEAMLQPMCWITNRFDRSPSELLWVPDGCWGPLSGSLLSLSYGYGMVFVAPHEQTSTGLQGGLCALPLPRFDSGVVRGRFLDDDLFVTSMFSWAGSQQAPGGLHRIRYRERSIHLPLRIEARRSTLRIQLTEAVDPKSVTPAAFEVRAWDLRRTPEYGSDHYRERELEVVAARLQDDGTTVELTIPNLAPSWGMSTRLTLYDTDGNKFTREIHHSIFELND